MILALRIIQWLWTIQAPFFVASSVFLLVNDILTKRWMERLGINSHLALVVRTDIIRHSIGIVIFLAFLFAGLLALIMSVPKIPTLAGLAISATFVLAEWLIGLRDFLDAVTTARLLNYHGLDGPTQFPMGKK